MVSFIKRAMGEPDYLFEHGGHSYRAEEISSFIIKKVVQDAEQVLGEKITDIVITCPAYFGINEREATKKAGEIAGYNVQHIINKPTAAAIAYGPVQTDENRVVLVYDLGGGTFDITMIEIKPDLIQVICTGGDHNLGGKDWDDRIASNITEEFQIITVTDEDILEDPDTCQEVLLAAEKAKIILGQREKIPVTFTYAGEKGYQKFDEIILVGGATRMPQIVSRIKKEFSMEPKFFDPDEAVAKGAAIFGSKLMLNDELIQRIVKKTGTKIESDAGMEEKAKIIDSIPGAILLDTVKEVSEVTGYTLPAVKESFVKIKDVTSKSFGIVVENAGMQEEVFNLIVKNTTVPIDIAKQFYTSSENQKTVLIRIMENEINEQVVPLEHSTEIATAILNLPHGLSKESPVQIIFRLNEEGRLKIMAAEKTESKLVKVDIETRSVIQGKAFQEAKARCQSLTIH